jgi:hypothetical protein
MDEDQPPPRRPIPLTLWALLGFLLVLGFLFAMRELKAPGLG